MIDFTDLPPLPVSGDQLAPAYDQLRGRGGVVQVRLPDGSAAWLVTSHSAVSRALADPDLSLDRRHSRGGWSGFALPPALDANLLNMDPPDHTRIRRLVSAAFTMQRVAGMRPGIRLVAGQLLDDLDRPPRHTPDGPDSSPSPTYGARDDSETPAAGAPDSSPSPARVVDLVDAYCAPLATQVIGDLLGVPGTDLVDFRRWTRAMLATGPADRRAAGQAIVELHAFIVELLRRKREQPADDLLSALIVTEEHGERLSTDELTSLAFLILLAGYENSVNLLANTVLKLLRHGAGLAGLTTEPERAAGAVEESLRQEPPAPVAIRRFPVRDLVIDGTTIPAGETVLLALTAANRDPAAPTGAQLAFGRGIHYCLGAALARVEATEGVLVLAERLPGLAMAVPADTLSWRPSFRSHGPVELPVTW